MPAADPETGRWTASALAIDGIEDLPGAHWMQYTMAVASASGNDYEALARHVEAFERASTTPGEIAWIAPFEAILAVSAGDPVAVLAAALSEPSLSPLERANLLFYDALVRNLPPATDADAARLAVRTTAETGQMAMPVTYAVLAMSLRESDPDGAMAALRRAEELAEETSDTFIIASTSAWGSLATLGLPTDAAAGHLLGRLDRLQSYYGNSAAALFTLCLCVLRRGRQSGGRLAACVPVRDAHRRARGEVDRPRAPGSGSDGRASGHLRRDRCAHPCGVGRDRRSGDPVTRRRGRGRVVAR